MVNLNDDITEIWGNSEPESDEEENDIIKQKDF
jgi:uncharacterized protein YdcH (DUF465 family)